jgi:hypothetical protein
MSPGDLVVVKEDHRDEGKVGVILNARASAGPFIAFCDVLFPDGVKRLNAWWLEPLEVPDASR